MGRRRPFSLGEISARACSASPDVIATTGDSETKALQLATQDIPIVFHLVADPVANPVGQTT